MHNALHFSACAPYFPAGACTACTNLPSNANRLQVPLRRWICCNRVRLLPVTPRDPDAGGQWVVHAMEYLNERTNEINFNDAAQGRASRQRLAA
jgi:hypothetical protein